VERKGQSVVIGRVKAVRRTEDEGGGLEYKGRAALATGEELLTLSRGWINFYLLRDSQETDNTSDEGKVIH
jgi:hypothetical protein